MVPQDCENVLKNLPVVQKKLGADYRDLFNRAQNGQIIENKTITEARACLELQRKLFAGTQ